MHEVGAGRNTAPMMTGLGRVVCRSGLEAQNRAETSTTSSAKPASCVVTAIPANKTRVMARVRKREAFYARVRPHN